MSTACIKLAGTKLYCLVTEARVCEQLAQGHYMKVELARSRTHDPLIASLRPDHYIVTPKKQFQLMKTSPRPILLNFTFNIVFAHNIPSRDVNETLKPETDARPRPFKSTSRDRDFETEITSLILRYEI